MKRFSLVLVSLGLYLSFCSHVFAARAFIVEKTGTDMILISDGISEYIIDHDYDCYDSDFSEGDTIYIESGYSPSYGDTIIIPGYSDTTCEVTSVDQVNIEQFYVDKVLDSDDKIIVTDKNGDKLLVEYGLGCGISMWRYEGKKVHIDIGGAFLDGIGDQMYLFDSGRDCKIWDGEEITGNTNSYSATETSIPPPKAKTTCPLNSKPSTTDITQCTCNLGFEVNPMGNACVKMQDTSQFTKVVPITKTTSNNFAVPEEEVISYKAQGTLSSAATFRQCPSTKCSVIRTYLEGLDLAIIGKYKSDDWYEVEGTTSAGTNETGWIHGSVFGEIVEETTDEYIQDNNEVVSDISVETTEKDDKGVFSKLWSMVVGWFN
jgi:hypothetical protein